MQWSLQLGVDTNSLPDMPTEEDVTMVAPELHRTVVEALLSFAMAQRSVPSNTGSSQTPALVYPASARAFLCRVLALLSIPYNELLYAECQISQQLYGQAQKAEMRDKSEEIRKEKEHGFGGKWGRIAATAGGVVVSNFISVPTVPGFKLFHSLVVLRSVSLEV
jgi:hypothetical protein